ncbi:MAG: LacI family DNA-binding transcriptional regulator [Cyclobacteriaceae bacterium]
MKSNKHKITIYDVADALGVSISTVSRALNDNPRINPDTIKRVKRMSEKMGFRKNALASGLMTNSTRTIGLVIPNINSDFISQVVRSIEDVASAYDYRVIICQSHDSVEKEKASIDTFISSQVDGILATLSLETVEYKHFQKAIDANIPVVFFDRVYLPFKNTTKIMVDNFSSAYRATEHLIEMGYKRIGYIGGSLKRMVFEKRLNGYMQALLDKNLIVDNDIINQTDLTQKDCYRAACETLNAQHPPDAILCANHLTSINTIFYAMSQKKVVPRDVAVLGFSESPFAELIIPSLTAIRQPCAEMGKIAAQKLIEEIEFDHKNEEFVHSTIVLETELDVRNSTNREYQI